MNILICNVGSTSLKYQLFRMPEELVVASGGAGRPEHLVTVFREAKADAAIVAGMIHFGDYTIAQIKDALHAAGVPTRMTW